MLSARSATPSVTRLSRCSIGCSLHRLFHQRLALGAVPFQRPVDAQHFLAFGVVDQRYRQPSRLHRERDHIFLVEIGLEVPKLHLLEIGSHRLAPFKVHRKHDELRLAAKLTRSEEHTSELQSLMRISYAVFSLQKKTNTNNLAKNSQSYTPSTKEHVLD